MNWEEQAQEKFKILIGKLPFFHRHIAEEVVAKKAQELATERLGAITGGMKIPGLM